MYINVIKLLLYSPIVLEWIGSIKYNRPEISMSVLGPAPDQLPYV